MENRNIYKADDVLIIGSFLMLAPTVYMAWPWLSGLGSVSDWGGYILSAREILGNRLFISLICLDGAVTAQILGRILRHREKQTLDILDTVLYMGRTTVSQVADNLSLPKDRVRSLTAKLTRIAELNIRMEGDNIIREAVSLSGGPGPVPGGLHASPESAARPVATPESPHGDEPRVFDSPQPESSAEPISPQGPEIPDSSNQWHFENSTGSTLELSPELKEILKKDKSDIFGKIALIRELSQTEGKITPERLEEIRKKSEAGKNKNSLRMIFLFFLFVTPLWPIPLIVIIVYAVKQYKTLNSKGMVKIKKTI